MSLRGVHLIFIVASILMAIVVGIWAVARYVSPEGSGEHLALAVLAAGSTAGLTVYAVNFVRKTRQMGLD